MVQSSKITWVATLMNTIGLMILVYCNFWYLIPKFFERKKFGLYAFWLLALLFVTASLRFFGGWGLVEALGWDIQEKFTPRYFTSMVIGASFILLLSIPLRLIENWFKRQELEKELKETQLEAELRFLKAQVNPHFLFNALNNIYSLSFTQSKKTPEMILKLSDMMSYMLYDCKNEQVPLSSEIDYLNNYIALQQLKKDGEQNIDFQILGNTSGIQITPMLFIPFFENAFKHGNLDDLEKGWLKSQLQIDHEGIQFSISNSLPLEKRKNKQGGVGLENIRRRLDLLYPDKHELIIEKKNFVFSVVLKIYIKN